MLHLHRAERADRLADALSSILIEPLDDPFAAEVVSVPTRGMERWLTQRMSARLGASADGSDGVCANVEFPFPGRLVGGALAVASGIDPASDPWLPERSVWPLLDVVEECLEEPWLAPLAAHLGRTADAAGSLRERRFGRVSQLASLYDHYAIRRPAMLEAWAAGETTVPDGHPSAWQAELWRRLRAALGVPSPAERLPGACARLVDEPSIVALPSRLALFGLTRLPASYVRALSALAAGRNVHLFLLHPSPALWDAVAAAAGGGSAVVARADDPSASLARNRLLASWGPESRELQLILQGAGPHIDDHLGSAETGPGTLLGRLQADIRADRTTAGEPLPGAADERVLLGADDRSVQVHACHGPGRQVEVLREAILHLLEADPTLEPRDIIVMCPDIETFAPLIHATFGAGSELDEGDLRVRLADRALRQTNPVLSVVARLIELAEQRLTASQLLDLADSEPVRRRFGFDDDDLAQIQDWVVSSGIRWGLDAPHRAGYKLDKIETGTWRAGLDRLLLGVTMSEAGQRLYERVLPVDDVDSSAIELVGRFAEFVDRVAVAADSLSGPQTMEEWAIAIAAAADALTGSSERDAWQAAELRRLLDDAVSEAGAFASRTSLALPELRALLGPRLRGRPTRANFRTGHLTVCTLVPMRSVPHRVVCLLGLDDGAFPRRSPRDGDDLLLDDPHVGDRDPRTEDRQMLLDALLAAGDHLIVTYSGNDERTNAPRPPAVPVGELLDAVDRTARIDGGRARDRVVVRHPLQPFDPRNFEDGELVGDGPWSFDRVSLEGAVAMRSQRTERPPLVVQRLPAADAGAVELDDVVRFVERPVRSFMRQRLGISVSQSEDEVQDALAVELDALERWGVGQRLLEGVLAGIEPDAACRAEIARGTLPPGQLGEPVIRTVWPTVEAIVTHARADGGSADPRSVETNVRLLDGRALTGSVSGVRGHVLVSVTFSRLNPRHRIAAWVRLLALSAAHPEEPFEAVTIGRLRSGGDGGVVTASRVGVLGRDQDARRSVALDLLGSVVDLRDRGLREPLPIPCQTSAAYAIARLSGGDPEAAATKVWESGFKIPGEDRDPEHRLAFGGEIAFAELLGFAPREDEAGEGWAAQETSRFGRYALRMWGELLARETVMDL